MRRAGMKLPTWRQLVRGAGRGLGLLLLLVVGLVVAGSVALKLVFTPERIRFLLIDQLEGLLHRQVVMDAVTLNPLGGVRVEGFKVLRKDKPWAEPFIESERFIANFQLWPLLAERRLVLDEIWLSRPRIEVIRRADGTWNFADLVVSSGTRPESVGPVALSVADARLTSGRVVFLDEMKDSRIEADQIQFRVQDFRGDGPFWFSLSFATEHRAADPLPPATVDIEGRLDVAGFDWARAHADLKHLEVRTPSWRFAARGYASDFRHPRGAIDADITPAAGGGGEVALKSLKRLVLAPLSAQAAFSLPEPRTLQVRAFQVTDRRSRVEGDGEFHFEGSSSTWRVHLKSPGLDLSDTGDYLRDLAPYLFGGRLEFETTVSSGPEGVRFGNTEIKVQNGRAVFGENVLRNADVTFAAPAGFPAARLNAANVSATAFGQELSEVACDAEIHGGTWTFHSLKGVWNGMRWNLRGKVEDFFRPTRIEVRGGADVIRVQEIVNLAQRIIEHHKAREGKEPPPRKWFEYVKYGVPKTFPALAGRLAARKVEYAYLTGENFAIRFDIKGMEPGMKNLNGYAQYAMGPGRILNTTAMMANSKFLRVIFLPFVTLGKIDSMGILKGWKEKENLAYRRIVGDYKATWGNVRVDELVIDTADILLSGKGQIDLPAESIQLYVLNRLYKAKGTLPETLTCDDGKPCLAFFVEGDLGLPDARLDLNKIRTQKGADTLKKRLEQFQILKTIIPTD